VTTLQIGFLYMAPWLALLLVLLCGRYPGERVLARLRARRARSRRLSAAVVLAPSPAFQVVSGGLLLAHRLAGRAPPLTG
jgi:hypothetical protein